MGLRERSTKIPAEPQTANTRNRKEGGWLLFKMTKAAKLPAMLLN
jgi:acyl-CoA hydrolase